MPGEKKLQKRSREFTFVHFTGPNQADHAAVRKRVRSAAATESWAVTRRRGLGSSKKAQTARVRDGLPPATKEEEIDDDLQWVGGGGAAAGAASRSSAARYKRNAAKLRPLRPESVQVHLPSLGSGNADPFNTFPIEPQPWYGWVLHYYYTVMVPVGFAQLKLSPEDGDFLIEWYKTLMMQEPALLYMRLFSASANLVLRGLQKPETALWLRGQTVKSINEALSDPKRATTPAVIITVSAISLHECLYGDQAVATKVHRPAVALMLDLVGGLEAWNAPLPIKDVIRWTDRTISLLTGTPNSTYSLPIRRAKKTKTPYTFLPRPYQPGAGVHTIEKLAEDHSTPETVVPATMSTATDEPIIDSPMTSNAARPQQKSTT